MKAPSKYLESENTETLRAEAYNIPDTQELTNNCREEGQRSRGNIKNVSCLKC